MEHVELADLNRLGGVLKNSKSVMNKTQMPVQNKKVFEGSTRANGFIDDGDYDEKPMPNLTEQYYARVSGQEYSGGSGDVFEFNESDMANSKLPAAVLDVMRESQKERRSNSANQISQELINEVNGPQKRKQQIRESGQAGNGGATDYSLIKMIVEECMKKYVGSLKKSLNESRGSALEMITQQGNTFRFVTTDGKVFEGKLTYKGNIKEK